MLSITGMVSDCEGLAKQSEEKFAAGFFFLTLVQRVEHVLMITIFLSQSFWKKLF